MCPLLLIHGGPDCHVVFDQPVIQGVMLPASVDSSVEYPREYRTQVGGWAG